MKVHAIKPQDCYCVCDEVLTHVTINSVVLNCKLRIKYYNITTPNGIQLKAERNTSFYLCEDDFKSGKRIEPVLSETYVFLDDDGFAYRNGFIMQDGEPKYVKAEIEEIVVRESGDCDVKYSNIADGVTIYNTHEDCINHNEYKVRYDDGREETRKGVCLLMALTPEQEKLKDELANLMRRIKESGMAVINESNRGKITCFNCNQVDVYISDCDIKNYTILNREDLIQIDGSLGEYYDGAMYQIKEK